jgi:hypothetical protein
MSSICSGLQFNCSVAHSNSYARWEFSLVNVS